MAIGLNVQVALPRSDKFFFSTAGGQQESEGSLGDRVVDGVDLFDQGTVFEGHGAAKLVPCPDLEKEELMDFETWDPRLFRFGLKPAFKLLREDLRFGLS